MTGPELRAALDAIGMSQREFASRFGLLEGSVSRWVHETRTVPSWVPPTLDLLRRADKLTVRRNKAREGDQWEVVRLPPLDEPISENNIHVLGVYATEADALNLLQKRGAPVTPNHGQRKITL